MVAQPENAYLTPQVSTSNPEKMAVGYFRNIKDIFQHAMVDHASDRMLKRLFSFYFCIFSFYHLFILPFFASQLSFHSDNLFLKQYTSIPEYMRRNGCQNDVSVISDVFKGVSFKVVQSLYCIQCTLFITSCHRQLHHLSVKPTDQTHLKVSRW